MIKTTKQINQILDECQTVADVAKAVRNIYKQLDEVYVTRQTVQMFAQTRKHKILMGDKIR